MRHVEHDHVDYRKVRKESATKVPAYIVDVDGTLTLPIEYQDRHIHDLTKCGADIPNYPVVNLVSRISLFDTVLIVSGREDTGTSRWQTEMWLNAQKIFWVELFMRKEGDQRDDSIVKEEIYVESIMNKYNVVGVIDDRPKVIRMWLKLGLFVFDVNNARGEF